MIENRRKIRVCMFPSHNPINEGVNLIARGVMDTGKVEIKKYNYVKSIFSRADLFHVHWPDLTVDNVHWPWHVIKVILFLCYVLLCKCLRRPIVWTVHNVGSHEYNSTLSERLLWRVFLPCVSWAIHLCPASEGALSRLTRHLPPGSVIPHPHYRSVYPSGMSQSTARQALDLPHDAFVVSSFGFLRPYKGFEDLVAAFSSWSCTKARLLIAGKPMFQGIASNLSQLAQSDSRIKLTLRSIENGELQNIICASNVIVLPYRNILNSGVAMVALSLNRPILAPSAGSILEYNERLGSDWILMFNEKIQPRDLQIAYEQFQNRDSSSQADLEWMDPSRTGSAIFQVYQNLLGHD